jgi:hypothetical protein
MIRRSAIALFSLVLTLGCLAPTPPTLGATGGTDRPIGLRNRGDQRADGSLRG